MGNVVQGGRVYQVSGSKNTRRRIGCRIWIKKVNGKARNIVDT